jgi:predicted TIM-barrel fold metal-dependent hydrolase
MVPFFLGRTTETYRTPREGTPELDRPIADYYRRFYYDTAVGGSEAAIRCGLATVGADRILLATDAPFGPPPGVVRLHEYPDLVQALDLGADDEAAILGGNAAELFDLDG